jgi:hypothetical protein
LYFDRELAPAFPKRSLFGRLFSAIDQMPMGVVAASACGLGGSSQTAPNNSLFQLPFFPGPSEINL